MSYIGNTKINFDPSSANGQLDAFKRLRVSQTFPLYSCKNIYDMNPLMLDNILVGAGTATFVQARAAIDLTLTTAVSDKVTRRSRQWIKYQPGCSQLVKITGVFGAGKTNVTQRMGLFDDNDGVGFVLVGTTMNVLRRTSTSGAPVDNLDAQSTWNLDKLDGTGPSGVTIDFTKGVIIVLDYEWLSLGRIRWGFDFGNQIIYVHEYSGVNVIAVPTFSTPDLPITWQIENVGAAASATTLSAICASVQSEGGIDPHGYKFSRTNGVQKTVTTAGGEVPVLTIRPKLTFGGVTNRVSIIPLGSWSSNMATTADVLFRVYLNATLTGAVYVSQSVNSAVEYDITSTAATFATAELVDSFVVAGQGSTTMDMNNVLPLTLNALGTISDTITITATAIAGAVSGTVTCGIDWKEQR